MKRCARKQDRGYSGIDMSRNFLVLALVALGCGPDRTSPTVAPSVPQLAGTYQAQWRVSFARLNDGWVGTDYQNGSLVLGQVGTELIGSVTVGYPPAVFEAAGTVASDGHFTLVAGHPRLARTGCPEVARLTYTGLLLQAGYVSGRAETIVDCPPDGTYRLQYFLSAFLDRSSS